jgi:hypothetical protein
MYGPYPRFGNPQTQLDSSAKNPLGFVYSPPWGQYDAVSFGTTPVFSTTAGGSTAGYGAPPVFKYVYFYDASATTGTAQSAPAPVYWIDESFTTVTSNAADAYFTTNGGAIAGYWMPNTTALGGTSTTTAAQYYAQFVQSYGWIQIGGLVSGAYVSTPTAAAQGNVIYGAATGSWASVVNTNTASVAANVSRYLGVQWSAISNTNYCDVLVNGDSMFWGS